MKKILKFYSKTCGPCKVMSKKLEELQGVEIQDIDIMEEENESLVEKWKVRTIPTIVVLNEDNTFYTEFKGIIPINLIQAAINGQPTAS